MVYVLNWFLEKIANKIDGKHEHISKFRTHLPLEGNIFPFGTKNLSRAIIYDSNIRSFTNNVPTQTSKTTIIKRIKKFSHSNTNYEY